MGKSGPDQAPDDGTFEWTDPRSGEVRQIPNGIDPGWDYTPGKSNMVQKSARNLMDKLPKVDARLGAQAMAEAAEVALPHLSEEFGQWVEELVAGKAKGQGKRQVVGAMSPNVLEKLADKEIFPASSAISIRDKDILHLLRDAKTQAGKALPTDVVKRLPEVIGDPQAVFWDNENPALLYITAIDRETQLGKAVVRVDYKVKSGGPTNMIISGGQVQPFNLKEGKYDLLEGILPKEKK